MKNPEELQKAIEDSPSEFIVFKIRPTLGDSPDEEVASTVKPQKSGKGKVKKKTHIQDDKSLHKLFVKGCQQKLFFH